LFLNRWGITAKPHRKFTQTFEKYQSSHPKKDVTKSGMEKFLKKNVATCGGVRKKPLPIFISEHYDTKFPFFCCIFVS